MDAVFNDSQANIRKIQQNIRIQSVMVPIKTLRFLVKCVFALNGFILKAACAIMSGFCISQCAID